MFCLFHLLGEIFETMGCLKSIIRKIIFICLLIAFFAFGGWAFVRGQIKNYQYPPREEFNASEQSYGDFSKVSGDYQLYRSFNLFGYKKINAKYLPTGQKITIFNLKNEEIVSTDDFNTHLIDSKIDNVLNSLKDSVISLEDFKIVQRGNYIANNKTIPFIVFEAGVKNIPFKNVKGTLGAYSTYNLNKDKTINKDSKSTKLILSIVDMKAYNPKVVQGFVSSLNFEKE